MHEKCNKISIEEITGKNTGISFYFSKVVSSLSHFFDFFASLFDYNKIFSSFVSESSTATVVSCEEIANCPRKF